MNITRHGKTFLKLSYSDKTIALNPVSNESKEKVSKFGSDIAISTLAHPDFNGFENVKFGNKEPFVIKGPGEYEISGIFINGYGVKGRFQGEDKILTSYSLLVDGLKVAFFAPISSGEEFSNEAFEEFAKADVFILPIGGGDAFSAKDGWKFLKQFGPKIIIPLYENENDLVEFKTETNLAFEDVEKISLKQKDLPAEGSVKIFNLKIS